MLTVNSHQIHIEQCDATFRMEFAIRQLHAVRIFFFTLIISRTGKYDQRVAQSDLLVNLVQQLFQILVQLIIGVLYLAGIFLMHIATIVACIISDGKHIRTGTCTESPVFEELKRQAIDFLIDKRRGLQVEETLVRIFFECVFERYLV